MEDPSAGASAPPPHATGRLRLAFGEPAWLDALEADLVLHAIAAGADAFIVSGDNRLDAYGLLAKARARRLETEAADGVWIARAFTLHQFVALLEETLPRLARERHAGVVLVTGLLEPFLDESDVPPAEARTLLARTVRRLDAWSQTSEASVLATSSTPSGARAHALAQLAEGLAGARLAPPRTGARAARDIESWGVA